MGNRVKTCPKCNIQHKKRGPFCGAVCANSRPKPRKNPIILDPRTIPGNYRLKNCKRCGIPHKKHGPYCSASCGNVRTHNDQAKLIRSIKRTEYHQTPEGIATMQKIKTSIKRRVENKKSIEKGEYILQPDDYAVQIPDLEYEDKIIW